MVAPIHPKRMPRPLTSDLQPPPVKSISSKSPASSISGRSNLFSSDGKPMYEVSPTTKINCLGQKMQQWRWTAIEGEESDLFEGIQEPSEEITKISTASSIRENAKNSLGHLTYVIRDLPNLYIVRVHTLLATDISKFPPSDNDSYEPLRSKKLRYKAIKELLERPFLKNLQEHIGVKIGSEQCPEDFLIIPSCKDRPFPKELKFPEKYCRPRFHTYLANTTKKVKGRAEEALSCVIGPEDVALLDFHDANYANYLDILLRANATSREGATKQDLSLHSVQREFYNDPPETLAKTRRAARKGLLGPLEKMSAIKLRIRKQMAILPDTVHIAKADTSQVSSPTRVEHEGVVQTAVVHLAFDLVPTLEPVPVIEALIDCFGHAVLGSGAGGNLGRMRHVLQGLHVRYVRSKDVNWSDGERCVISDVRLPSEVPSFAKEVDGRLQTYSVVKYFNNVLLDKENQLRYAGLPLANIGKVDEGKQVWVPLEMLRINHVQGLHRAGDLMNIRDVTEIQCQSIKQYKDGYLVQWADEFLKAASKKNERLFKWSAPVFTPAEFYEPSPIPTVPGSKKRVVQVQNVKRLKQLGVIYVAPTKSIFRKLETRQSNGVYNNSSGIETMSNGAQKVSNGTKNTSNGIEKDTNRTTGDLTVEECEILEYVRRLRCSIQSRVSFSKDAKIGTITSRDDLYLAERDTPNETDPLSKVRNSIKDHDCDEHFVLAVVDESGRTKSEIRHLYQDLQTYGNLILGVGIVCTTLQSLRSLMKERAAKSDNPALYFPPNILRKINFMQGGINFDNKLRPTIEALEMSTKTMILGAHVAHDTSDVNKHSPSVASVVGSIYTSSNVEEYPSHYAGSSRFQSRIRRMQEFHADIFFKNHEVQSGHIESLYEMMTERFLAWKESRRDHFPGETVVAPSSVIFYRDGLVYDDKTVRGYEHTDSKGGKFRDVIHQEMEMIQAAFDNAFINVDDRQLKLAYILLGKKASARPTEKQTDVESSVSSSKASEDQSLTQPKLWFTTENTDTKAKYIYTVFQSTTQDTHLPFQTHQYARLYCSKLTLKRTTALNLSSQLAPSLALALPIHFAQKLCRRMHEYVNWSRDGRHVPTGWFAAAISTADGSEEGKCVKMKEAVERDLYERIGRGKEIEKEGLFINHVWRSELSRKMFYL